MQRLSPATLVLALAAGSPSVLAASATHLSVTGIITPSACSADLSKGGVVDHGKLAARDLSRHTPTTLQLALMILEVHCEAPTLFTLTALDNRAGSSAIDPALHGLGTINDEQMLGSVAFGVFEPVADKVAVNTIVSRDGGASWETSDYLGHAALTAFAAPGMPNIPIALQHLYASLLAVTVIVPADQLPLLDEVPIDGHATLQIKYW
ncbi:Protein of unknown function [Pseudomonas libanensis]|uniref:Protein GltF n=1 Tax=Pseudomonas libanensis TaxID=75588 RepID=A0A0R2Y7S3_9PSED|nr:DUF1120 domain-containing protein [Pseudomonas libanensis]KRP44640.1 hypothetical protein TU73_15915 [Pseudomonas libanensis]SDL02016.1 Protein of unknown function [Pseudomonas libanensis]